MVYHVRKHFSNHIGQIYVKPLVLYSASSRPPKNGKQPQLLGVNLFV